MRFLILLLDLRGMERVTILSRSLSTSLRSLESLRLGSSFKAFMGIIPRDFVLVGLLAVFFSAKTSFGQVQGQNVGLATGAEPTQTTEETSETVKETGEEESGKSATQSPDFLRGVQFFQSGKMVEAYEEFSAVLRSSKEASEPLLINLGLVSQNLGRSALAYAYFLTATHQFPFSSSAKEGLLFVRAENASALSEGPSSFFQQVSWALRGVPWWMLWILECVGLLFLGWRFLSYQGGMRRWTEELEIPQPHLGGLWYAVLILTVVLQTTVAAKWLVSQVSVGVLVQKDLGLKSFPDANSAEILKLPDFKKVQVLNQKEDYFHIETQDGLSGWVPVEAVLVWSDSYRSIPSLKEKKL